ncbi:hypothetical protein BB931_05030 [Spiribacter salinus]|nr:hypothetical protein [Spiribacter salinus]
MERESELGQAVILLAGRPSEGMRRLLQKPNVVRLLQQKRLVPQLHFHDSDDQDEVFAAADVVWVAYTGGSYGSSGVLHQAVGYGLPVIAGETGLVGMLVKRFNLGATVDPRKPSEVAEAILYLLSGRPMMGDVQGNLAAFRYKYSAREHVSAVADALEASSTRQTI